MNRGGTINRYHAGQLSPVFFFVELPLLLLINYQTLKDYRFLSSVYRSSKSFDSRRDIRELTGGGKSYLENTFRQNEDIGRQIFVYIV